MRLCRRERLSNDKQRTSDATTQVKNLKGFVLSAKSQTSKAMCGIFSFTWHSEKMSGDKEVIGCQGLTMKEHEGITF